MKNLVLVFSAATVLGLNLPNTINAATQVYDLKADWSDTQNPNGAWSYRLFNGDLLLNDPFPWNASEGADAITRTTVASVAPGYLELGDIYSQAFHGVTVRWTAPANGMINVGGTAWNGNSDWMSARGWMLTHNGSVLSEGSVWGPPRSSPYDFSSGSGGAIALQNIPVKAADQIEMAFSDLAGGAVGVNFTVTLTPDLVDPLAAIEALATTVIQMNLQNGISNSLDSKLDAALNVLTDVNQSNHGAACNSLQAFISAVDAQRGKKITNAQADQLIASAQEIKSGLGCAS